MKGQLTDPSLKSGRVAQWNQKLSIHHRDGEPETQNIILTEIPPKNRTVKSFPIPILISSLGLGVDSIAVSVFVYLSNPQGDSNAAEDDDDEGKKEEKL